MHRIRISKESTAKALDEQITIILDKEDVQKYVHLLTKTWPSTRIKEIKRYA